MTLEALPAHARSLPDGSQELLSPAVGWYTQAPARGILLQAGERAGVLLVLGRPITLLVPEGLRGRVATEPPLRRRMPVEFGQVLCLLTAPATGGTVVPEGPVSTATASGARLILASQAGRFWRRPDPSADEFLAPGAIAEAGCTLGLLEVMKTFQPVKFKADAGQPERARLLRWRVENGAEVKEGDALAEFESA